jgi:hypothetical protein
MSEQQIALLVVWTVGVWLSGYLAGKLSEQFTGLPIDGEGER